jgi:ribonuclease HII
MGTASVREIDQLGIRQATALAMQRAVKQVDPVDHILVDGLRVAELGEHQTAIVKGDAQCLSIAAASIIAKVNRDRWMIRLDRRFPGYGWADNVGYGTAQHRQALLDLGLTQHHRRSFIHLAAEGID